MSYELMRGALQFSIILNIILAIMFIVLSAIIVMLLESFRRGDMCDECCPYKVEPSNQED